MKAYVIAPEETSKDQINGVSQSFLPLEGRPLLLYVLMALDLVDDIEEITVVGPQRQIMQAIEQVIFEHPFSKKITVLEEKTRLQEHFREAHEASRLSSPTLFISGNIPYVTSAEISTFIAASDRSPYDFCLSISSEAFLNCFTSEKDDVDLIKGLFFQTPEGSYALGHVFIVRTDHLCAEKALQEIPALFSKALRGGKSSLKEVEAEISENLQTGFKSIETPTGGNVLPVHDALSYQFIVRHFEEWRRHISGLKSVQGEKLCSISGKVCHSE